MFSRTSGMDEAALTHVDAVMTELIEEDQVTRLELIAGHRGSILVLPGGIVGKRYTDVSVDVLDEAGAVEALWTRSAPSIRRAELLSGNADDTLAATRCRSAGSI